MKRKLIFIFTSVFIIVTLVSIRKLLISSGEVLGVENQDLIIRRAEIEEGEIEEVGDGKKLVALTFDDGPAPITKDILKVLEDEDISATFFVVGTNIDDYPEILIETHEKGHEIGNHTNSHPVTLWMSQKSIAKEILINEEKISQIIDVRPLLLRAPYAFYPKNLLSATELFGMILVSWDVDPEDWKKIDSTTIIDRVIENVKPGSIILLHDGPPELDRSNTLNSLVDIIGNLKNEGYEFVTVSELLEL